MTFYQKFSELCKQRAVTPSKAAIEMGISKSNVASWKRDGSIPRLDALNKIARYFGLSTDLLLKNVEAPTMWDDIGSAIREEREKQCETVKQLADYLDISASLLRKIELDERPLPDNLLQDIADHYGYGKYEFLDMYNLYPTDLPPEFAGNPDGYEAYLEAEKFDHEEEQYERSQIGFDDFSYAMHNESKKLTKEQKQMLLNMAHMFKEQLDKENNPDN